MRGKKTLLYSDGGPDIDPDIVIYSEGSPQIVVDAKDFATSGADAAGVYQVNSYARHLKVRDAGLFYLAVEQDWSDSFGDESIRIHAFGIPPHGGNTLQRLRAACLTLISARQKE
jgi:5-methylcytosine-specific restriction endonuclease McrBC regulatory subunit McrC